jgi:hypothetical protein
MASKPLETGKNLRQIRFFPSRVLFVFNEQNKQNLKSIIFTIKIPLPFVGGDFEGKIMVSWGG